MVPKGLRLDYLLHSIAVALDNRGFGVVKEAIQQRRSKGAVVIEDFRPFFENPVRIVEPLKKAF